MKNVTVDFCMPLNMYSLQKGIRKYKHLPMKQM